MSADNMIYVLASQAGQVGGAAKATHLLCESLAGLGLRVRLFVTLAPNAETAASLERLGVEVVTPWLSKGWRLGFPQWQIAFRLWLSAKSEPPSLVLSISLSTEAYNLLGLPGGGDRLVLWETTEALPHVKFLHTHIHRRLHRAAGVACPSGIVERNVRATYGYEGEISRLPFWVGEPGEKPDPAAAPRSGRLLYVGRLDPDKGFKYLFEAFALVRQTRPNATLSIRGGGDPQAIRRLGGDQPGITVGGYLSGADYEAAIADCEAVILPSLHEGYPLSLLEACARGRPIVATRVGSIPEIFDARPCAILVPPGEAEPLAQAMAQILDDEDQMHQTRCADALAAFDELSSQRTIMKSLSAIAYAGAGSRA